MTRKKSESEFSLRNGRTLATGQPDREEVDQAAADHQQPDREHQPHGAIVGAGPVAASESRLRPGRAPRPWRSGAPGGARGTRRSPRGSRRHPTHTPPRQGPALGVAPHLAGAPAGSGGEGDRGSGRTSRAWPRAAKAHRRRKSRGRRRKRSTASSPMSVFPASIDSAGRPACSTTARAISTSSPPPVTKTVRPASASSSAIRAQNRGPISSLTAFATGWITVAPGAVPARRRAPQSRSRGIRLDPRLRKKRRPAPPFTDIAVPIPPRPPERASWVINLRGWRAFKIVVLCGPGPCILIARFGRSMDRGSGTSAGWLRRSNAGSAPGHGMRFTSGRRAPRATSTRRQSAKLSEMARSAGTVARKSFSPRTLRTRMVGLPAPLPLWWNS